jgi:carbohydrate kinase (thermoresistant glucokinase family)
MGVAGAGKTTAGHALSNALCWTFYDGDDFHSTANIEKMQRGEPLSDADRAPWLATLNSLVADVAKRDTHAVMACSALKESYRAAMIPTDLAPGAVRFVYLDVPKAVLHERLAKRTHFFPPELLNSQLETLEKPRDAVRIDGTRPPAEIVQLVREALGMAAT